MLLYKPIKRKWDKVWRKKALMIDRAETNSPHLFAFTLAPLLIVFPSFLPLRGSSARTPPTPADDFLTNFDATSRPWSLWGDVGKDLLLSSSSTSSTTSFNSGSSAALPPKKYKSRKTPKHTAITTTLQWIRMVRATCCGCRKQRGPRSCLRVGESCSSWHFVTVPRSHFSADDDGERRGAPHRPWRITQERRGFYNATVTTRLLTHGYFVITLRLKCASLIYFVLFLIFYLSIYFYIGTSFISPVQLNCIESWSK